MRTTLSKSNLKIETRRDSFVVLINLKGLLCGFLFLRTIDEIKTC
jgi:hypothetical protein